MQNRICLFDLEEAVIMANLLESLERKISKQFMDLVEQKLHDASIAPDRLATLVGGVKRKNYDGIHAEVRKVFITKEKAIGKMELYKAVGICKELGLSLDECFGLGSQFDTWADFESKYDAIDLSHRIDEGESPAHTETILAESVEQYRVKVEKDATVSSSGNRMGINFKVSKITSLRLNHGTHMDFPGHIAGISVDRDKVKQLAEYPLSNFIMEAIVFDATTKRKAFKDRLRSMGCISNDHLFVRNDETFFEELLSAMKTLEIGLDEFKPYIGSGGLKGKAVLLHTGLCTHYNNFLLSDTPSMSLYCFAPYVSCELAAFLKDSGIRILGIDSYQIENPIINFKENIYPFLDERIEDEIARMQEDCVHQVFLRDGIFILENLRNLKQLRNKNVLLCCPPLNFKFNDCDDNSITRALAFAPK